MNASTIGPGEVVAFWGEAGPRQWFSGGEEFDRQCEARFLAAHYAAARRELEGWTGDADGALALVLLLDQIPRNVFRNSGHAFATDPLALHVASRAIDAGHDTKIDDALRFFFYMPFEHSEDLADQQRALDQFAAVGDAEYQKYAQLHYDLIARFGRFPHRNEALGRDSTQEELDYLAAGGVAG